MIDVLEGLDPSLRNSDYGRCQNCWTVVKRDEVGKHQQWHLLLVLTMSEMILEIVTEGFDEGTLYA